MAAGLPGNFLPIAMRENGELLSVQIARELQAGMTSSFTR